MEADIIKSILLDTNMLYYFMGITATEKIDSNKLNRIINNYDITLSIITIFEIYNNPFIDHIYIFNKLNNLKEIIYISNPMLLQNKFSSSEIDELMNPEQGNSNTLRRLYEAVIDFLAIEFGYIISLTCSFFPTSLLNYENESTDINRYRLYQTSIDKHMHLLQNRLIRIFQEKLKIIYHDEKHLSEKNTKNLFRLYLFNITNQFIVFYNKALSILDHSKSFYLFNKYYIKMMNSLEFEDLIPVEDYDYSDMNFFKHIEINKAATNKFIQKNINIISKNKDTVKYQDQVDDTYLTKFLLNIYSDNQSIKINDLLDKEILKSLFSDNVILCTLDNNMIKYLKNSKHEKSKESLKLINSILK